MLEKLSQIRKDAYLEYLALSYRLRDDRNMFAEDKERLKKQAYKKYKDLEEEIDEIEFAIEMEELHNSRPVDVQI
ncbi:hypothetical protein [Romboutsia hominis]|uniref:Uncharacterized protein n=1 Tax=Romboutsia hominis TaxID=1507512 RepID=A0A2P2BRG5_9FIRM|nr:hypothetical protein [Romboutsia hominis]CEI72958.1 Hypothetical protein FRIFI_1423 [Romboutsia hominis]